MVELHFHRYRYYLLFCIVVFIIVNCFFINDTDKIKVKPKEEYVSYDNLSVIRDTSNNLNHHVKAENNNFTSNTFISTSAIDNCKDEWTNENIVGRCFGLDDVNNVTWKMTAQQCRDNCCSSGKDCITWQFIEASSICKNGGKVRIGGEGGDTPFWCDPLPPSKWEGKQRVKGTGCTFDVEKPSQCFGLGPERFSHTNNNTDKIRMPSWKACESACCAYEHCSVYQYQTGRGCFFNIEKLDDIYCDLYSGTYSGGRKRIV